MNKTALLALALFLLPAFSIAQGDVQSAVTAYYQAAKDEDMNAYLHTLATPMNPSQQAHNDTKTIAAEIWKAYDTVSFSISDFNYVEDSAGEYALAKYRLQSQVSGRESFQIDLTYISLLQNEGGQWKIVFAMPLADYLEAQQQYELLAAYDRILEQQHNFFMQPTTGTPGVLFNGMQLTNLSDEIYDALYSCTSDAYCIENGLSMSCVNGYCITTFPEQNITANCTGPACNQTLNITNCTGANCTQPTLNITSNVTTPTNITTGNVTPSNFTPSNCTGANCTVIPPIQNVTNCTGANCTTPPIGTNVKCCTAGLALLLLLAFVSFRKK